MYKWMNTFHELNKQVLEEYAEADTPGKLAKIIAEYWGEQPPC